jgi:hypothetical protein
MDVSSASVSSFSPSSGTKRHFTRVVLAGIHFVQEDSPDEIGRAIAGWMAALS